MYCPVMDERKPQSFSLNASASGENTAGRRCPALCGPAFFTFTCICEQANETPPGATREVCLGQP